MTAEKTFVKQMGMIFPLKHFFYASRLDKKDRKFLASTSPSQHLLTNASSQKNSSDFYSSS